MNLIGRLASSLAALGVAPQDRLGVACSGGADSVALLRLLARIRDDVVVLHVDHRLRADSHRDASFVEGLADELGFGHLTRAVDVDTTSDSIEAAARDARYRALEEMAEAAQARSVATAHTLDDQAETVVLRLMRGGGLDAIAPVRGIFVRPVLDVGRDELRSWLEQGGHRWLTDPTNTDTRFERNWVREVLMPLMAERRAGVAGALAALARRQRTERDALDALASDVFARAEIDDVGVLLHAADVDLVPAAIAVRVIRAAMRRTGVEPSAAQVEAVRALRRGRVRVGSVDAWRIDAGIALVPDPVPVPEPVTLPSSGTIRPGGWGVEIRVGPAEADPWRWRWAMPGHQPAIVRSRRPGDRVRTAVGTKKVQDVLVDAKVPRPLRGLVPVLASPRGAIAVVGMRCTSVRSGRVVDVEPCGRSWSREQLWNSG